MTAKTHGPVADIADADDVFIRMVVGDAHAARGFAILAARDAREALETLEHTPGIARIFTDIYMPGDINGLDLAEEVARRFPHIECYVTSGGRRRAAADIPDPGRFLQDC